MTDVWNGHDMQLKRGYKANYACINCGAEMVGDPRAKQPCPGGIRIGPLNNTMPQFIKKLYAALEEPQETDAHHAVDDGYCSCGVLCETGTRFRLHLKEVAGISGGGERDGGKN